ncbi:MAG: ATP-binding cassette domain-containing protein [Atopobiaceae bacterium]|nr:ATP-binding cassette domain-containing protein [Atopobiaceae bacterium]
MLEARELTLAWGDGREVVRDVSLRVATGETVCIVGRSGSGKTTLLHALAGLTHPRSGSVFLDEKDITGEPGHIGYMFQKDLLLTSKTVLDNVCLPLVLRGVSHEQAREKALPLLERFGLGEVASRWPSQLSGGMRQRAAFARTYLMGSSALLLDEPFSALDALTRTEMREWFLSVTGELGLTVVMVSHDPDEALLIADRVVVLVGNPAQGHPATLAGEIDVLSLKTASSCREGQTFELSSDFLEAKKELLELLGD